jgi:hypothetical protein
MAMATPLDHAALQKRMDELRQAAWVAEVMLERRRAAEAARQQAEERAQKKKIETLRFAILEAAFDGDDDILVSLLRQAEAYETQLSSVIGGIIEIADGKGNTLLSEASAGGALSTVKLLLDRGADPNAVGEFGRTPLYRAAFAGHLPVAKLLLEKGADPRIPNAFGELPDQISRNPPMNELIRNFDRDVTERHLRIWVARRVAWAKSQQEACVERTASAQEEAARAKKAHDVAQAVLKKALQNREKRLMDLDEASATRGGLEISGTSSTSSSSDPLTTSLFASLSEAEKALDDARRDAIDRSDAYQKARLLVRVCEKEEKRVAAEAEATLSSCSRTKSDKKENVKDTEKEGEDHLAGLEIAITDLNDVVMLDVGDVIAKDGRWPLVIDKTTQAATFLKYTDTNYVNTLSSLDTSPGRLRKSLIGALRYGKPLVFDVMDVDMWDRLAEVCNAVLPGLWEMCLNKEILREEVFSRLLREEDGEEYQTVMFTEDRLAEFKVIVVSSGRFHPDAMLEAMYTIRVKLGKGRGGI